MTDFLAVKAFEVVGADRGEGVMIRDKGLHDDPARSGGASCSAGYLGQELEGALGGTKIREMEADICGDHADELDAWEIVSLGDHLGADDDVDLFVLERFEDRLRMAAFRGDIAVESHRPRRREDALDFLFESFRPDA